MSYSFDSRVRFSETDANRNLTLNALINYFQDCSTFQSESLGDGVEQAKAQKRVWMLASWQIVIERYPKLCENIKISTWPYGFRRSFGDRNFMMEDEGGNRIAYANSLWVYVNTETGVPQQIPETIADLYGMEKKLDMEYAPRRIKVPKEGEELEHFTVLKQHLDVNQHVNNGQYIQMASAYLEPDFEIHQMRAEYKSQAKLGDIIVPKRYVEEDRIVIVLSDINEQPYTIVEIC